MKPTILLVDIDGVLLDFVGDCDRSLIQTYGGAIRINTDRYKFALRYPDHWVTAGVFVSDPEFFSNVTPLPGAVDAIRELRSLGVEIHAITSCLYNSSTVLYRDRNLLDVFGDSFKSVTYLPMGHGKHRALNKWRGQPAVWVDDLPEHVNAGVIAGIESYMVDQPYNSSSLPAGAIRLSGRRPWESLIKRFS